ncbi:MAG: aspartate aminotransferase family protein [Mycobacterium leprae]
MSQKIPHLLATAPLAPVEITHAQGTRLHAADGKVYVDLDAAEWCMALGHSHPAVAACIHEQMGKVMHLGPLVASPVVESAAATLAGHTPHPDGKVIFLSSGTEAMEMGLRLSRLITGRTRFLTFQKGYLGAYGLSGTDFGDTRTEIDLAPCLGCTRADCTAACPNLEGLKPSEIAAFAWEPVLGSSAAEPPHKLVRLLTDLVQEAGGLAVVDEVTTGMGRTGSWWGFEHAGVTPDIIACGKALGNGYPVSAVILSPAAAAAVEASGFRYAQSHQNDPLAAAVAQTVIDTLEATGLIEQAALLGEALGAGLRWLAERHPLVVGLRGVGLMRNIQLKPFGVNGQTAVELVRQQMLARGYILVAKPAVSQIRLMPPLIITAAEVAAVVDGLDEALTSVEQLL